MKTKRHFRTLLAAILAWMMVFASIPSSLAITDGQDQNIDFPEVNQGLDEDAPEIYQDPIRVENGEVFDYDSKEKEYVLDEYLTETGELQGNLVAEGSENLTALDVASNVGEEEEPFTVTGSVTAVAETENADGKSYAVKVNAEDNSAGVVITEDVTAVSETIKTDEKLEYADAYAYGVSVTSCSINEDASASAEIEGGITVTASADGEYSMAKAQGIVAGPVNYMEDDNLHPEVSISVGDDVTVTATVTDSSNPGENPEDAFANLIYIYNWEGENTDIDIAGDGTAIAESGSEYGRASAQVLTASVFGGDHSVHIAGDAKAVTSMNEPDLDYTDPAVNIMNQYTGNFAFDVDKKLISETDYPDYDPIALKMNTAGEDTRTDVEVGKGIEGSVQIYNYDKAASTISVEEGGIIAEGSALEIENGSVIEIKNDYDFMTDNNEEPCSGQGGNVQAYIKGDVTSITDNAVDVLTLIDGYTYIEIEGDVTSESGNALHVENGTRIEGEKPKEISGGMIQTFITGDLSSVENNAIEVEAYQDSMTIITVTGDVESEAGSAILVDNNEGAETTIYVKGDVNGGEYQNAIDAANWGGALNVGITGDIESGEAEAAVYMSAEGKTAKSFLVVEGDVTAGSETGTTALKLESSNKALLTASVTGDSVAAFNESEEDDQWAVGVDMANGDGDLDVLIQADIFADGTGYGTGVYVHKEETDRIYTLDENAQPVEDPEGIERSWWPWPAPARVGGDYYLLYERDGETFIEKDGTFYPVTYEFSVYPGAGESKLTVIGDVTANTFGIDVDLSEGQTATIIVDGSVSGDVSTVNLSSKETVIGENLQLAVWELVPNPMDAFVTRNEWGEDGNMTMSYDFDAEKAIQYIVKVADLWQELLNYKAISTAAKKTVNVGLDKDPVIYHTAAQDEDVLLNFELGENEELEGIYYNADKEESLVKKEDLAQDENGNWIMKMLRGGTMLLGLKVKTIVPETPAQSEDKQNTEEQLPGALPGAMPAPGSMPGQQQGTDSQAESEQNAEQQLPGALPAPGSMPGQQQEDDSETEQALNPEQQAEAVPEQAQNQEQQAEAVPEQAQNQEQQAEAVPAPAQNAVQQQAADNSPATVQNSESQQEADSNQASEQTGNKPVSYPALPTAGSNNNAPENDGIEKTFGEKKTFGDQTFYVNDTNGTSSAVLSKDNDITWLREESGGTSAWYGFEGKETEIPADTVISVRWISDQEDPEEFAARLMQAVNGAKSNGTVVEDGKVWIFDLNAYKKSEDGSWVKENLVNGTSMEVYIEIDDSWDINDIRAFYLDNNGNPGEELEQPEIVTKTVNGVEKKFANVKMSHFSFYALYDAD